MDIYPLELLAIELSLDREHTTYNDLFDALDYF